MATLQGSGMRWGPTLWRDLPWCHWRLIVDGSPLCLELVMSPVISPPMTTLWSSQQHCSTPMTRRLLEPLLLHQKDGLIVYSRTGNTWK